LRRPCDNQTVSSLDGTVSWSETNLSLSSVGILDSVEVGGASSLGPLDPARLSGSSSCSELPSNGSDLTISRAARRRGANIALIEGRIDSSLRGILNRLCNALDHLSKASIDNSGGDIDS
jgi:hypothetical protein